MSGIKTTARNQVWIVQKRVAGKWCMITDALFMKRKFARECSNQLNSLIPNSGRGPNRRYRVTVLRPAEGDSEPVTS